MPQTTEDFRALLSEMRKKRREEERDLSVGLPTRMQYPTGCTYVQSPNSWKFLETIDGLAQDRTEPTTVVATQDERRQK
jgi:hypothetical protein